MKKLLTLSIAILSILLASCNPGQAAQTQAYDSAIAKVAFDYPADWQVSENEGIITIASRAGLNPNEADKFEQGQGLIVLFLNEESNLDDFDDPVFFLNGFASIGAGLGPPHKEEAHVVTLNGKTFAIGAYDATATGPIYPNFIAAHLENGRGVIAVVFTALANEPEFRTIFESVLGSLEVH